MSFRTVATLAVALSGLAASAHATDILLPNASYFGGAKGYQYLQSYSGPNQGVSHTDLFNTVSASSTAFPGFSVQAFGSTTDMGGGTVAEAHARYYFVLLSAFPNDIHVLIDAVTQVSGAGYWFGEAEVDISAKDGSLNQTLAYSRACGKIGSCDEWQNHYNDGGKVAVTLTANKIYSIALDVNGHTTFDNSAFSVFADPKIAFDPAYDRPEGVTFQFSQNLPPESLQYLYDDGGGEVEVPVGGVPEPTTWAMMLIGFGGMGSILRRRRAIAA